MATLVINVFFQTCCFIIMEDEAIKDLTDMAESEEESDEGDGESEENDEDDSGNEENEEDASPITVQKDSSKIDKEALNILIVSLRPCIAQAKVHLIHQLARQVAGLKKKKCANDQEKTKNERKVTRFVEEISILKRANKDVISRWLVVNTKTFAEVTKQETLSQKFNLKVRVFARTGDHQAVKKVLDNFKVNHPQWEKEMPKVLRALGKKRKKTDPNKQELGIKPLKNCELLNEKQNEKIGNKVKDTKVDKEVSDDDESAESSSDSESEEIDKRVNKAVDFKDQSTDSESDTDDGIVHNNDKESSDTESEPGDLFAADGHVFDKDDPANYSESENDDRESDESDDETDSGDEGIFVSSLKEALKLSHDGPSVEEHIQSDEKPGTINKKSGEMLVKVLDLQNAEEDCAAEDRSAEVVETDLSKKKISSFFVGGESESEEEKGNSDEEELFYGEDALEMRQEALRNKFQKEGRAGVGLNGEKGLFRGRGGNDGGRGRGLGDDHGRGRGIGNGHDNGRGRGRGEFDKSRGRGDFHIRGRGTGDFHRGGRGDFHRGGRGAGDFQRGGRGKYFNESNRTEQTPSVFESSAPVRNADVDNNLHPSWAAKKRASTTIAKFEGKKIKFGDDGGSVNSYKPVNIPPVVKAPVNAAPAEKLHPSWAAKQNQKSSIQAFQGKRVVFGD